MRYLAALAIAASVGLAASPAQAAEGVPCSNSDINVPGGTVLDCSGFVLGNAVGGQATTPTAAQLLAELGYTGSLTGLELLEGLNGNRTINFNRLLFGQTIVGIHYGNGQGSPGRPPGSQGDGGDTAFYLFDAGTAGLDSFTLNFNASSNARLYSTGVPSVPEPSTWAMMLLGFLGMGTALRRSRKEKPIQQLA